MGRRGPRKQLKNIELALPSGVEKKLLEYPLTDPQNGLVKLTRDRLTVYEGALADLCSARIARTMLSNRKPKKRVILRLRQYAELFLLCRAELETYIAAAADCRDSDGKPFSYMEREYEVARRMKYGTPGFGRGGHKGRGDKNLERLDSGKDQPKERYHPDRPEIRRRYKQVKMRLRRAKKLVVIEKKTGDTVDSIIAQVMAQKTLFIDSNSKAAVLLMDICKRFSWDAKLCEEERVAHVGSNDYKKISKPLIRERDAKIRDLHAIGYDVSLIGPWAVRCLSNSKLGRPKKKKENDDVK